MKNRSLGSYLVLLMFIIFFTTSCQYETIELDTCTDVSFATDIQPIFDTKCVSCHGAGGGIAGIDFSAGNSYAFLKSSDLLNLNDPESSKLYEYFKAGHNGANADDACKILGWIEEGAQEGEPVAATIVYNDDIQPLFNANCIECHNSTDLAGNIDLSEGKSFASLIENGLIDTLSPSQSTFYTALDAQHSTTFSDDIYETIENWIEQGAVGPPVIPSVVSFANDIQPVFNAKCTGCHGSPSGSAGLDLSEGNSYTALQGNGNRDEISSVPFLNSEIPESSGLYIILTGYHDGKVTSDELTLITLWMSQGAEDNK